MAHKNTVEPRFTVVEVIKFIEPGFGRNRNRGRDYRCDDLLREARL